MSQDLSLVQTSALIRELFNRHDHAVFVGMQDHNITGPKMSSGMRRAWKGKHHVCVGMCQHEAIVILSAFERECQRDEQSGE